MVTYGIISDSSDFLWLLNNVRLSRKCTFAIASSISFNGYLRFVKYIFNSFKCEVYMFTVCTYFVQCIKNIRVNSIVRFCIT